MPISLNLFGRLGETEISSFEYVRLHISGMRGAYEYEITAEGDKAECTLYGIRFSSDEDLRIPEKSACCSAGRVLELLNGCKVLSWDGFSGKHPKGVHDGIMFRFEAEVNEGKKIRAEGSENFPKHYREFEKGIRDILDEQKEGE